MCLSAMSMHLLNTSWDGDHRFLVQHVPMPNYSFWEEILPDINSKPLLLQLEDFSLHPNLKWSGEMKCSALMDLLEDLSLGTCSCQEQIWVLLKLVVGNRWGSELKTPQCPDELKSWRGSKSCLLCKPEVSKTKSDQWRISASSY